MEESLFTEEPATLSELAARWNCHVTQLLYLVRSREIPHVKIVGGTRLFDATRQRGLYAILHQYPIDEQLPPFLYAPRRPRLEEEEGSGMEIRLLREKCQELDVALVALTREMAHITETVTLMSRELTRIGQVIAEIPVKKE